ncbi:MAG: hypothetical protein ACRCYC_14330 [Paraclostridium sp.]|uniref:hypothetical protein n=1 Tax=Paraclostridium sp. TaxID=2023273 RepID=UPI003F378C07
MTSQKNGNSARNLILTIVLILFTCVTFSSKTFAQEKELNLKDINGDFLKTGKKYYISNDTFKNRGLTFEVYNNWDYVLATNEKNDGEIHGTPIQLYIENTNEKDGLLIGKSDKVILKMQNHNWEGHKYFKFDRTGGYVWLDKDGTTVSLEQDNYKDGIAMNAGSKVTKYYDSFGRITGSELQKYSVTDDTYLYLFPSGQVFGDSKKLWLSVYMRRHFHINNEELIEMKPTYFFTPAV